MIKSDQLLGFYGLCIRMVLQVQTVSTVSEGNSKPVNVLNKAGGCVWLRMLFMCIINSWMKVWMVGFFSLPCHIS